MLPALLLLAVPAAETHVYKRVGPLEIKADVFRQPGAGPHPVLMFIHGGALIMGSRKGLASRPEQLRRYFESGLVVVSVDYRLAPETKLPELWKDLEDAYAWIRRDGPRLFGAAPDRIAVAGQSAGGYLTLMAGARFRPSPRALVSWYGYGDIAADWYAKPDPFYNRQPAVSREEALAAVGSVELAEPPAGSQRGRFYLYTRQQGLWPKLVAGFDPVSQINELCQFCPLRLAGKNFPPTMLLHGDNDTDVPVEQSILMAQELARVFVAHEKIILPGRPHGFDRAMDDPVVADAFDRSLKFLLARLRR
jgi:acetyl esterase/lipase